MSTAVLIAAISIAVLHGSVNGNISCIGEKGTHVDMFIIYKLSSYAASGGGTYIYLDSENMKFRLSRNDISSKLSAPGRTLEQVYKNYKGDKNSESFVRRKKGPKTVAHVFYNDAVSKTKYTRIFGHTKGEMAFDKTSGFWMITSVPKFPGYVSEGYKYPHSGRMYGQMFLCVTFKSPSFKDIASQMLFSRPRVYDSHLPKEWRNTYKEVYNLLHDKYVTKRPYSKIVTLKSSHGVNYIHFVKQKRFHKDLYHDLVARQLHTNLLTETWQRGHKNNIGPSCDGNFTVLDIRKMQIRTPTKSFSILSIDDHSKFAIGQNERKPYVCIGDINRQISQFKRGGGLLCMKNALIWKQFKDMVVRADKCDDK